LFILSRGGRIDPRTSQSGDGRERAPEPEWAWVGHRLDLKNNFVDATGLAGRQSQQILERLYPPSDKSISALQLGHIENKAGRLLDRLLGSIRPRFFTHLPMANRDADTSLTDLGNKRLRLIPPTPNVGIVLILVAETCEAGPAKEVIHANGSSGLRQWILPAPTVGRAARVPAAGAGASRRLSIL
jgi:hypothetical protein